MPLNFANFAKNNDWYCAKPDKDTDKTITDNDIFTDKTQFMLLSLSTLFLSPAAK